MNELVQVRQLVQRHRDETYFMEGVKEADEGVLRVFIASVKTPQFEKYAYLVPKVRMELEARVARREKQRFQLTLNEWEKAKADLQKTRRLAIAGLVVGIVSLIVTVLRWLTNAP